MKSSLSLARSTTCLAILLSWIPLFTVSAGVSNLTLDEVLEEIGRTQDNLQDFHAGFVETIQPKGQAATKIRGTLSVGRPFRLRVDQKAPERQTLVSDGADVRLYTPAAGQEIVGKWKNWAKHSGFPAPVLGMLGEYPVGKWSEDYTVLFGGHEQGAYKVILKPRTPDVATLELWVSDETFLPTRGRMANATRTTDIRFDNVRMNVGLKESHFTLDVPKGTAVVPMPS